MKSAIIKNWKQGLAVLTVIMVAGCTDNNVGPTLPSSAAFKAPVITNAKAATPVVLVATDANKDFETFTWHPTTYGGPNLSTDYYIQISTDSTFKTFGKLAETGGTSVTPSVDAFNSAALSIGVPGFSQAKVYVRVRSTLTSYAKDTLYSDFVRRTITTYQLSDCGTFCAMGVIGDASPGSWSTDTDMHLADATRKDKHTWAATVYLVTGASIKFRADHAWDNNWGGTTFPSGTGSLNGANIGVTATGYYSITFNDQTLAYTATAVSTPVNTQVSVLGDATPGGWNADTDLTQDSSNPHLWAGTVNLVAGAIKFRVNHDWGVNWGGAASPTVPSGYGVLNGANIGVALANTYHIVFNDATLEYYLGVNPKAYAPVTQVGVIGPATPGGWDTDTFLTPDPANPFLFSAYLTLADGDAKIRANAAWDINWGGAFPQAVGAQDGNNIPVKAGKYFITVNTLTGEYYFLK